MKHIFIVFFIATLSKSLQSQNQIPYPSKATFDACLNRELSAIETYYGLDFSKLKRTTSAKTTEYRSDETNYREFSAWPKDICANTYTYSVPKVENGISGEVFIEVSYRRSVCGQTCELLNEWKENGVKPRYDLKRQPFNEAEAKQMMQSCLEFAKDSLLANFIRFNLIEPTAGGYIDDVALNYVSLINFNELEFGMRIEGEIGQFLPNSICMIKKEPANINIVFRMKYENHKWKPIAITHCPSLESNFFIRPEELKAESYRPLRLTTVEAISGKYETGTQGGDCLEGINSQVEQLQKTILSRGSALTAEDLLPFFSSSYKDNPTDRAQIDNWLSKVIFPGLKSEFLTFDRVTIQHIKKEFMDKSYIFRAGFYMELNFTVSEKKQKMNKTEGFLCTWTNIDGTWKITNLK